MKMQMIENSLAREGHISKQKENQFKNLKQIKKNMFALHNEVQA
jgi:hypothetical protein